MNHHTVLLDRSLSVISSLELRAHTQTKQAEQRQVMLHIFFFIPRITYIGRFYTAMVTVFMHDAFTALVKLLC